MPIDPKKITITVTELSRHKTFQALFKKELDKVSPEEDKKNMSQVTREAYKRAEQAFKEATGFIIVQD